MPFLDEHGVETLWNNTKSWFAKWIDVTSSNNTVTIDLKSGWNPEDDENVTVLDSADIPVATSSAAGVMSKEDKSKLDGVATGATANVGTITEVKTTSPLSGSGTSGSVTVSHSNSGVSAGSYGPASGSGTLEPGFGSTFNVAGYTVNTTGHVTGARERTVKMPNSTASTTTNGLMSSTDKVKLNGIAEGATANTGTIEEIASTGPIVGSGTSGTVSLSHADSGVTSGTYGDTATTALTPAFGDNINVPGISVNTTGHVTGAGSHTVKIPENIATVDLKGLMSSDDKAKLNGIEIGATKTTLSDSSVSADTPSAVGPSASVGTSTKVARADHVHNIVVGEGDSNGQVKVGGQNASVKGLKSAAYTESSAYATSSHSTPKATTSTQGHTKLSDATDGTAAAASGGTAATPKAVSDALTAAKAYTDTAVSAIDAGVTGVKGNSESTYRTGDVNITAANVGAAASSHTHGNITNGGDITATAPTVASGDKIIINDESASKITNGPSFGTSTTTYLRNDGTWQTPTGTTYNDFTGATSSVAGAHGLVPAPATADEYYVLSGDGHWVNVLKTLEHEIYEENAAGKSGPMVWDGDGNVIILDSGVIPSQSELDKLSGIATGAEVNQNAFSNVKVGSTTVAADGKTDTLELAASGNITLTPDATNDKVTISTNAEANVITSVKQNGTALTITNKAVDVTVPTKTSDLTNDSDFVEDANYVHTDNNFTSAEKTKLSNIAAGATAVTVDSAMSSTSTNPVQNKVIYTELGKKVTAVSGKGLSTKDFTAAYETKLQGIATGAEVNVNADWNASSGDAQILNKPTTLSGYGITDALSSSLKGANNGLAELGSDGKVPSSQLPSYVDDVLEYSGQSSFPSTGESGKIYVDTSTNKTYRWSGTAYVEISPSLVLGTTHATAGYGDESRAAYTHGVTNKGSAFTSGLYKITTNSEGHVTAATAASKSDIGLGNVDNTSDANKPVSTAVQTALNGKANSSHEHVIADITDLESKSAASGGTALSLVTTGEKATWNAKTTNTGTVRSVTAGAGLTGGISDGGSSGTVKANLKSETQSSLTAASMGSTSGRQYAVGLDANGNLSVNVPWTDGSGDIDTGVTSITASSPLSASASTGDITLTHGNHAISDITDLQTTLDGKAVKSHASSATTYGKGTSSNYGHVKLSDATDGTAAAASGGTAATPKAVSDALTAAKSYADTAAGGVDVGVTGVKGSSETTYRTGNVSITAANVGAAAASHEHAAGDITSGTLDISRIPTGTTSTTVALGDHTHSGYAASSHAHGNITSGGDITATAPTVGQGDCLVINDDSASKITNGPSFGTSTTTFLANNGTWQTPAGTYSHPTTTAVAAAAKKVGHDELGHVVLGAALTASDVGAAASSHAHGNITSGGDITATAPTISSGDCLVINDDSASKITNGPAFGTSTSTYLRNDGSWGTPVGTTYSDFDGATATKDGASGLVPQPDAGEDTYYLKGDGTWANVNDNLAKFSGATSSSDGDKGIVPAPEAGEQIKVLSGHGDWRHLDELIVEYTGDTEGVLCISNEYLELVQASSLDTKNTAGSSADSNKLYIVGAKSQAASAQTYSNANVYEQSGKLYSNAKEVVNLSDTQALTNKTYNGLTLTSASTGFTVAGGTTSKTLTVSESYTLGNACAKSVDTSISEGSTSTNLPTTAAVAAYVESLQPTGSAYVTATATIPTTGWTSNSITVNVTGVTATNDVFVAPAPASSSAWADAGILCTAQGAGTLTFTRTAANSSALTANIMIWIEDGTSNLPQAQGMSF